MEGLFYTGAMVAGLFALSFISQTMSAIHEIEMLICVLISAVCLVGGGIVGKLAKMSVNKGAV